MDFVILAAVVWSEIMDVTDIKSVMLDVFVLLDWRTIFAELNI